MALIFEGESRCSIRNEAMDTDKNVVLWSAFLDRSHKLWKYSDSGMHQECFSRWKHKEEFEDAYKNQPLVDFEAPELRKHVKKYGMPAWLMQIKKYREGKS